MARAIVNKNSSGKATGQPVESPVTKAKSTTRRRIKRTAATAGMTTLQVAMTGRASYGEGVPAIKSGHCN